ncbi:polysaccharide deacetylase family protein [Magnetococcus sp. PR-3]|uniref:polysaccharide deacetylase family protein n=1 Tax=Magnetococcus sp. PR-3 TaxID=3120355 RepID=UPI002FCDF590
MMHSAIQLKPLSKDHPPMLQVVVDTEEVFDWHAPFDRAQTDVSHMRHVHRVQEIFDRYGIKPIYVVDHPVASQPQGYEPLAALLAQDRCMIGAHLHPWVSPPHDEVVNTHNAYPGNLPYALEQEKLERLTHTITANFGQRPVIYKAGRYGFGPNSAEILAELGYHIDLSPSPGFDQSVDGGPDHSRYPYTPFTFAAGKQRLLCLPTTGGFMGGLHRWGPYLQPYLQSTWAQPLKLGGIFSRLGLLSRLRLSPEGFEQADLQQLTQWLMGKGERLFTLSFHSPSWEKGHTPYVQSETQLQEFLNRIDRYCHFFMHELGGVYHTPATLQQMLK